MTPRSGSARNAAVNGPASARAAGAARRRRARDPPAPASWALRARLTSGGTFRPCAARCLLVVPLIAACGGGERQDADEPEGTFKVEVVGATFPQRQHIAQSVQLRLRVHNADRKTLRNVAVTVETKANGVNAPAAFGQRSLGPGARGLRAPDLDPRRRPGGRRRRHRQHLVGGHAARRRDRAADLEARRDQGRALLDRLPRLARADRQAQAARGRTSGTFEVTIDDEPVPARVGGTGGHPRCRPAGLRLERGDVDGLGALGPGLGVIGDARRLRAACGSRRS